jgi:predicted anti-sigma-YlaC factor YlaD
MSEHVTDWLNAYLDGELHGSQLHHVEAHLAECQVCEAELRSLQRLSSLLHEIPAPEFTSPERFAAQVNLRLPHQQTAISGKKILEIGWWMVPVGLLGVWIFIGTAFVLSDILSAASNLGLLSGISNWLASGSSNEIYLSTTIGQMGLLSGNSLNWAEATETFTRMSLPQISLQISIALLYLSWIAIWWARHTRHQRQQHGQLLEG